MRYASGCCRIPAKEKGTMSSQIHSQEKLCEPRTCQRKLVGSSCRHVDGRYSSCHPNPSLFTGLIDQQICLGEQYLDTQHLHEFIAGSESSKLSFLEEKPDSVPSFDYVDFPTTATSASSTHLIGLFYYGSAHPPPANVSTTV